MLRNLSERLTYLRGLEERKETVLASIEEQGKLTDELKAQILSAETMVLLEDLYRPYKPKRRTRATIAKEKGLEPLAGVITLQMIKTPLIEEAAKYVDAEKGVTTAEEAIAGASDIIAESISDEAEDVYKRQSQKSSGSRYLESFRLIRRLRSRQTRERLQRWRTLIWMRA